MKRLSVLLPLLGACHATVSPQPSPAPPPPSQEAMPTFDFERTTPFRSVVEKIREKDRWDLRLASDPSRHFIAHQAPNSSQVGLLAIVVSSGVSLKTKGGNVAPGCNDAGPGVAVPRRDGALDLEGVRRCAKKLHDEVPQLAAEGTVAVTAAPDTSFADLLDVVTALRGDQGELFGDIAIVVGRR